MRPLIESPAEARFYYEAGNAHIHLTKAASVPVKTDALSGRLYFSKSGWLLLSVPNALGQGAFDALDEAGVELPTSETTGRYSAHITVMRPEEIAQIGGPEKITERGHSYRYSLGAVHEVEPQKWDGVSKVWYIEVDSQDLRELRRSYGLTPLPNENKHQFHITFGVRKTRVLQSNGVSKAASFAEKNEMARIEAQKSPMGHIRDGYIPCGGCGARYYVMPDDEECPACGEELRLRLRSVKRSEKRGPAEEYCPHCDARLERDPYSGTCNSCGKAWPEKEAAMSQSPLDILLAAKAESDRRNYTAKHALMRKLLGDRPTEFSIETNDDNRGLLDVMHTPTGFRMHLPSGVMPTPNSMPIKAAERLVALIEKESGARAMALVKQFAPTTPPGMAKTLGRQVSKAYSSGDTAGAAKLLGTTPTQMTDAAMTRNTGLYQGQVPNANNIAMSGRHGAARQPLGINEPFQQAGDGGVTAYRGFTSQTPLTATGRAEVGGPEWWSALPSQVKNYATNSSNPRAGSYVASAPVEGLKTHGPASPAFHPHLFGDTRFLSRGQLAGAKPVESPFLLSEARTNQYERVFTNSGQPVSQYASTLHKELPRGGWQQVRGPAAPVRPAPSVTPVPGPAVPQASLSPAVSPPATPQPTPGSSNLRPAAAPITASTPAPAVPNPLVEAHASMQAAEKQMKNYYNQMLEANKHRTPGGFDLNEVVRPGSPSAWWLKPDEQTQLRGLYDAYQKARSAYGHLLRNPIKAAGVLLDLMKSAGPLSAITKGVSGLTGPPKVMNPSVGQKPDITDWLSSRMGGGSTL